MVVASDSSSGDSSSNSSNGSNNSSSGDGSSSIGSTPFLISSLAESIRNDGIRVRIADGGARRWIGDDTSADLHTFVPISRGARLQR